MKTNKRASSSDKNSTIFAKISDFLSLNSFVMVLLILGVWVHQVFVVGNTIDTLEKNQKNMVDYLKENVNKVYFLSASGMVITATKSAVSYEDERFKSYIANQIINNLIAGNVVVSENYKVQYASPDDLVLKNKRINHFFESYIKPHGTVIAPYARALHRAIVEGKYPEYINVLSQSYEKYSIIKPCEDTQYKTEIRASLSLKAVVKSWIRDLKEWDTREVVLRVPFKVQIDVDRYVNFSNPFGIHFLELGVPILHKPTGTEIIEGKK